MCGIAGILSFDGRPVFAEELQRMCAAMVHRGPDDEGHYVDENVGLAMRRLSIIDVENGRQPLANEDGSIWVVLNGEIYNFPELRRDLLSKGHHFQTRTDTEIIVHLYEEHGQECVRHLRGMFGFALWDARRRQLLLARDRLGIKPLYYARVNGRLSFASELKVLLQLPEIAPELNWGAVRHLLAAGCTPLSESIVRGVRKLEPGHLLVAGPDGGVAVEQYWDVAFDPEYGRSEADVVEELRERLEESVRVHLVSDVPLGAFLSGGIDSSAVVAAMARQGARPLRTFSIGFRERDYSELDDARVVAERLGTEHQELVLEPDVLGIIDDLPWHLDEPFGDSSAIPTYMVSKLAAGEVKVVLSGDGGDELFAGYDKYLVEKRERKYRFFPAAARGAFELAVRLAPDGMRGRNFLRHFSLSGAERYLDASTLFPAEETRRLLQPEAYQLVASHDPWSFERQCLSRANGHWLSALQYLDFKSYLPLDILTKVDRMSMAHSLEARVPLLDHRLVEFAARIPPELKLRGETRKYIFKRALTGILPDQILNKRKQGFAVPLKHWFRGQLGLFVREILLSERSRQRGIWNPARVETLLRRQERGRDLDLHLWTLITFELWCRTFVDGGGRKPPERPLSEGRQLRRQTDGEKARAPCSGSGWARV